MAHLDLDAIPTWGLWGNVRHVLDGLDSDVAVSVTDFGAVGDGSTDDTTAIQDAIDAVASEGGGKILVPPTADYYLITSPIVINTNDLFLDGWGAGSQIRSNSSDVIQFTGTVTRFTMRDLMLRVNDAGSHCLNIMGVLSESLFQNSYLSVWNAASSAVHASGNGWELLDTMFLRNTYDADGNSSTVPVIDLVDTAGGICNINTFLGGRIIGSLAATAPLVRLSCQASNYMDSNNFIGMNFQTNPAGAMLMEGNAGTLVSGCGVFDIGTATNHVFEVSKHVSGLASRYVRFANTLRHGGTISTFYDIHVTNGNFTVVDSSGANTNGKIDFNGLSSTAINPAATTLDGLDATVLIDAANNRIGPGLGRVIQVGSGSPEGVVSAPVGSLYLDSANGVAYIKATGSGNTGWVALATV